MRIFQLTVGKDEADRYLVPMLMHSLEIFDDVFFYDDHSSDHTPMVCAELNCSMEIRSHNVPSFMENEGAFRGAAWEAFERHETPHPGDWVFVVDCDEFLVSWRGADPDSVRTTLEAVIAAAGNQVVDLSIPEVWGYEDGVPMVRTDGLWNTIHAPRLFPWRPGGMYVQGDFGVPAVPHYVMGAPRFSSDDIWLMHYGYADITDQRAKYGRYRGHNGHLNAHVESILQTPTLAPWGGPYVPFERWAWKQSMSS